MKQVLSGQNNGRVWPWCMLCNLLHTVGGCNTLQHTIVPEFYNAYVSRHGLPHSNIVPRDVRISAMYVVQALLRRSFLL